MLREITRLFVLIGLFVAAVADNAVADIVRQEFKAESTRDLDGVPTPSFHVDVEGRTVDGYIVYTITNLGEDWPTHAFAGLFSSRSHAKLDNARLQLKSGESYQLVVDFKGNPAFAMDFVLRPRWVPQEIMMRVRHTPPPGWREAGAARSGKIINKETALLKQ